MKKLFAAVAAVVLAFAVPAGAQDAKQDFVLIKDRVRTQRALCFAVEIR